MQRLLLTSLLSLLLTSMYAQRVQHVILITIDGGRPDFYLDSSWNTPHLRQLMRNGVYAYGVNSVFPSMTYPSHTTIVTGVQPARHGVYYNGMFDEQETGKNIYWNDSSIHVPTLWSALHAQGKKVAALLWPVSAGAPVDYNIPDIGSLGDSVREAYSRPAGFVEEVKMNVFGGTSRIDYGKNQNVARIAAYVIEKDAPALMTIHFFSVDHAEHLQGRDGEMVRAAVADADSGVAIIQEAVQKKGIAQNTVIIVTGDHGFKNVTTTVNPNVWLTQEGLISDIKQGKWKALFHSVGGSAYLYLKDKNDRKTARQVKDILDAQPDSVKKYFRIIDRAKMNSIGGNPEVAFALTGENGASFGNVSTGEAVKPGKGGSHGYFPDSREIQTGFIISGAGIQRNEMMIPEMNLRDIAPIVAKLLHIPFPTAEGKIPTGIFSQESEPSISFH